MALFNDVPKTAKEQEKRLFEAAQFILETSVRARSKGILELETVSTDALPVSAQSKVIIKRLFDALIECVDLSDLSDIARYSITASETVCSSDSEKLAMMMIAEGIVSIQQGAHPRVLGWKLASMLGDELGAKLLSVLDDWMSQFFAKYVRKEAAVDIPKGAVHVSSVEDILFLDDKSLRDFSAANPDVLVPAIAFADDEIKQKVLRCVSPDEKERIEKELSAIEKPTLDCREKLVTLLRSYLRETGEKLRDYLCE